MDEIWKNIGNSLANGNLENWLIIKILFSFLGGLIAYYIKKNYLNTANETKVPFWHQGLMYSIISSIGGMLLIRPHDIESSFIAGLLGFYAIINLIQNTNNGVNNPQMFEKILDENEIMEMTKNGNY